MSLLAALVFVSQISPQAIASEREKYRINPTLAFYSSPEARSADVRKVRALRTSLMALRGKVAASKENLLQALELSDEIEAIDVKLDIASTVAVDLDETKAGTDPGIPGGGSLEDELGAVTSETLEAFAKGEPKLEKYRFHLEEIRRGRSHRLPARDEALVGRLRPFANGWQLRVFEDLRTERPTEGNKEVLATTLINMAGFAGVEARMRGYSDAVDAFLSPIYLNRPQVNKLLAGLAAQRPILGAARIPGATGETPPPFSLADATRLVLEALAPLGPEYHKEMADLFDPKNGRIDVAGGPHRGGLGTGWGYPASQVSILYWPVYTGVYDDLDRGLSHEGGHAIHFQMMRSNGVLPCYSEGPGYFFESFAEFNQLLLADYLYRKESNPKRKLFYLRQFLEKAGYPIRLAFFPALEFSIYDAVAAGKVSNAKGLDALEERALKDYDQPGIKLNTSSPIWSKNENYYAVPLYNINHALGAALADAYFTMYERDPKGFVPRYLALLKNGFDASPNDLLKKFLGFDLDDPAFTSGSGELIKRRQAELETLVKAVTIK